jgi:hypothetical protein
LSRQSWTAGIVTVGFLLACTGEMPQSAPTPASTPPPAPAEAQPSDDASEGEDAAEEPPGEEGDAADAEGEAAEDGADGEGEEGTDGDGAAVASDAACCAYDGPLGETHALVDTEAECTSTYADNNPRMVAGAQCVPVCCKYPEDAADLSKGDAYALVATGNCTLRKGEVVPSGADTCRDPDVPAARPRPKPSAAPVTIPPLKRPTPGGAGPGGTRPRPRSGGGGQGGGLTRPGG